MPCWPWVAEASKSKVSAPAGSRVDHRPRSLGKVGDVDDLGRGANQCNILTDGSFENCQRVDAGDAAAVVDVAANQRTGLRSDRHSQNA